HLSTSLTVLVVLAFNVIALMVLEIPLLGYLIKPEATASAVQGVSSWLTRRGGQVALIAGAALAIILILRGIINW
ncbi:MAG: GAP family protein, partial [Solirubrobacterales bacterium]|nr:GAP family protein [Solirubrobacterales bacterium]